MIPGEFISLSQHPYLFRDGDSLKKKRGTKMIPREFISLPAPLSFQGCKFIKEKRGDQSYPRRVYNAPSTPIFSGMQIP
jgi:hypothetical protein